MELADHSNVVSSVTIDRDHGFKTDLEVPTGQMTPGLIVPVVTGGRYLRSPRLSRQR